MPRLFQGAGEGEEADVFNRTDAVQLIILFACCVVILVYGAFVKEKAAIITLGVVASIFMAGICASVTFAVLMGRAFGGDDNSGWINIFVGVSAVVLAVYFLIVALRGTMTSFACVVFWVGSTSLIIGSVFVVRRLMSP